MSKCALMLVLSFVSEDMNNHEEEMRFFFLSIGARGKEK
jgi:hypothetical protein